MILKMYIKHTIVFILLLFQFLTGNAQSPWTREKGHAYVQTGVSVLFFSKAVFDSEKVTLNKNITDITSQFYAEYGISNKLEVQAILPYKSFYVENQNPDKSSNFDGFGNATFGLKYKFFDKKWKWSSGISYSANFSKFDTNTNLSSGFNANTILAYISTGSSKEKFYYFFNIGYGYMDNNYSDYLRIVTEVGYNFTPKGHFILVLDTRNIISKESAFVNDDKQSVVYMDRQTYIGYGLKINYEFKKDKFGINLSAFGGLNNNNAPLGPVVSINIYLKL
jgi:hypothetical protein